MKRSFTVTELLVAIAIIVILAGILIGGMGYAGRRADDAKTVAAIQTLSAALEAYRAEKGFFPPSSSAVEIWFSRKSDGLYLHKGKSDTNGIKFYDKTGKGFLDLPTVTDTTLVAYTDAWDQAISYQCPGAHNKAAFDLSSKGRDKIANNDDDISNWNNASQQ